MKKFIIKSAGKKGKGLFAAKNIKKGEVIMKIDLSKYKSYTNEEIKQHPLHASEHWDYVGKGKWVLAFLPYSYINHSCDPNILVKHKTNAKSEFIAIRNIKKGEELNYDYGVNALDQFEKNDWIMKCKCGQKNCRKNIPGDFFKQPKEIQLKYWKYLPASIRKKYKKRLK